MGLAEKVVGMSFDTTASNTGRKNGACILLETKLKTDLLYFACRHRILELVIGEVFSTLMGPSHGPEILIFKKFQSQWESIDKTKFQTGAENEEVSLLLRDCKSDILKWAKLTLEQKELVRGDYCELLEISIVFLGDVPFRGIHFQAPGPMHRARWMAKIIYSMKIWMFRSQFTLTSNEEHCLRDMCIFTIKVYQKAWMEASFPISAPRNDLALAKTSQDYHDKRIGTTALNKLSAGQLWYLSEELVALAFFDQNVPDDMKRQMVAALDKHGDEDPPKRAVRNDFSNNCLADFVTKNTRRFFTKIKMDEKFLTKNPGSWNNQPSYLMAKKLAQKIQVINDTAEHGVALMQEYNRLVTHDEDQLQFLMQIVTEHRRAFPDSKKSTLLTGQQWGI